MKLVLFLAMGFTSSIDATIEDMSCSAARAGLLRVSDVDEFMIPHIERCLDTGKASYTECIGGATVQVTCQKGYSFTGGCVLRMTADETAAYCRKITLYRRGTQY